MPRSALLVLAPATLLLAGLVGLAPTAAANCLEPSVYSVGVSLACPNGGDAVIVGTCGTGVGAGAYVRVLGRTTNPCVTECTTPGGASGVTFNRLGGCVAPPTVRSCATYLDAATGAPAYPGTGVVVDFPDAHRNPGDNDAAACAAPICPAGTYGAYVNGSPVCVGAPTLCSTSPGVGWTVGVVGVACVPGPWVGTTPLVPPFGPTTCPTGTTVGVTVYPGLGAPWNLFCF